MAWANKRRHKRYSPKELTFVVLHQVCCKIGPVVSVGKGGLAFEYVPLDEFEELRKQELPPHIDLIVGQAPMFLPKIPCDVVYDFAVKDDRFLAAGTGKRCCGLKFGELSEEQARGLDSFLESYAVETEN